MTPYDASAYRVLCVDDEPNILSALRRMLGMNGYQVTVAETGTAALELLARESFHALICDMRMPQMNGVEVLEQALKISPLTMRLLLTGAADQHDTIQAINRGQIYRFLSKPWNDGELLAVLRSAIEMGEVIRGKEMRLRASYVSAIKAFSGVMQLRMPALLEHSKRVASLSKRTARELGLEATQVQEIFIAGLLHDVGKVGLIDRILHTPFFELPLGDVKLYKKHPAMGELCVGTTDELRGVAQIVRAHHEYHDGSGYPDRLAGEAIPMGARIVSIAEAYEELIGGDYAAKKSTPADALRVIHSNRGKIFDPTVTDAFCRVVNQPSREG